MKQQATATSLAGKETIRHRHWHWHWRRRQAEKAHHLYERLVEPFPTTQRLPLLVPRPAPLVRRDAQGSPRSHLAAYAPVHSHCLYCAIHGELSYIKLINSTDGTGPSRRSIIVAWRQAQAQAPPRSEATIAPNKPSTLRINNGRRSREAEGTCRCGACRRCSIFS
jgi:hypothetical protein